MITGLEHVAIFAEDTAALKDWYVKVLMKWLKDLRLKMLKLLPMQQQVQAVFLPSSLRISKEISFI